MNRIQKLLIALSALTSAPVMGHVGPEAASSHFFEHMLIALLAGVPVGYALLRQLGKQRAH